MSADVSSSFPPSVQADLNQIQQIVAILREGKIDLASATRRIAAAARSIQLRIEAATYAPVAHAAPDELGPRVRPQTIDPHAAPPQDAKAIVAGLDVTADEVRAKIEEVAGTLQPIPSAVLEMQAADVLFAHAMSVGMSLDLPIELTAKFDSVGKRVGFFLRQTTEETSSVAAAKVGGSANESRPTAKEFAEPLKPIRGEILELQGPIADASKAVADLVESLLRGEVEVVKKGTTAKVNPLSPVEAANAIFQKAKAEKLRVDRPISIEARFDPDGQSLGFQLSAAISDDSMFDVK